MPPPERQLQLLLRLWTGLFGIGALLFLIAPSQVTNLLALPPASERFWNALAVAMMAAVTALSYEAQKDVPKGRILVRILLVAKATSTLGFALALLTDGFRVGYLAGVVCDGSIFWITAWMYRRVFGSADKVV